MSLDNQKDLFTMECGEFRRFIVSYHSDKDGNKWRCLWDDVLEREVARFSQEIGDEDARLIAKQLSTIALAEAQGHCFPVIPDGKDRAEARRRARA